MGVAALEHRASVATTATLSLRSNAAMFDLRQNPPKPNDTYYVSFPLKFIKITTWKMTEHARRARRLVHSTTTGWPFNRWDLPRMTAINLPCWLVTATS